MYGNWEYWDFVRRLQIAGRPDVAPTLRQVRRYAGVWHIVASIALSALLAGCAAGALTCTYTDIQQGAGCEPRPALIRWTPNLPKGMR